MAKNYQLLHKISYNKKQSNNTYAAICLTNREYYTIKITDLDELKDHQFILNEIQRTRHIRHSNILPLVNCMLQESQIWSFYPNLYFGSLRDILNAINTYYEFNPDQSELQANNNQQQLNRLSSSSSLHIIDRADEQKRLCFNEQSLQPITKSVLNALDYLHQKHIIHRCVCPDNIYITQSGHIYLAGLGHSVSLIEQGFLNKKLHEYPSNSEDYLNYLSPEILQQNLIGYNTKSDIYSLGVTLCELANGTHPFVGCEKAQMFYEKLVGYDIGLWDRSILTSESKNIFVSVCASENPRIIAQVQRRMFSEKFRNFVDLCVLKNYELRPSTSDLLHHVYLKKMKLNNCLQILQMSILSEGLVELQKKSKLNANSSSSSIHQVFTNQNPDFIWNFENNN